MQAISRLLGRIPPRFHTPLAVLIALVPTILLFAPALTYPLLNLDDTHAVTTNPGIRELSWEGIRYLFLEDRQEMRYFPLTYVSFAIDYRLFGLDPFGYHLTNLLLHLANTLLVFGIALSLARDRAAACITALLFGIHPLQVESVAWVTSRKNVLFLFFFLLSIVAYLRHVHRRGETGGHPGLWLFASAGLYLASCLSKTAGITLPAVLVLIDYWRAPARPAELWGFLRRSLPNKLVYLVLALLVQAASARFSQPNPFATEYAYSGLEWLLIVGHNLFFYVAKTIAPIHLGVFYELPEAGNLPPHFTVFAGLAVALVALTVWAWWREWTVLFFGLAWYLVTILPMTLYAAFFSDIPILAADRYHYQSLIGLGFLTGVGASTLWSRRAALRAPLLAVGVVAFGALFTVAASYRHVWRSTVTLYQALLEHHPTDEFYYRLAGEHMALGHREEAFRAARAAQQAPRKIFFLDLCRYQLWLAEIYRQMGDLTEAARLVEAAIEAAPNFFEPADTRTPFAYGYLAHLYEQAGDPEGAARARAQMATARPDPRHYFAVNWLRMSPEASREFLEAHRAANPDDGLAWYYLGVLSAIYGDKEQSRKLIEQAVRLGYLPQAPPDS